MGDCKNLRKFFPLLLLLMLFSGAVFGQGKAAPRDATQPTPKVELADDGIPVLVKHLPDWEAVRGRAQIATNLPELQSAAGNRPILETTDFAGGTEAVAANYDAGKLVIVEYQTAPAAIDADAKIRERLNQSPQTVYRKVGNYAVFVFDAPDEASANSLIDRVAYEKQVQWLGENPFPLLQAQRAYAVNSADIILTTVKVAGIAIVSAFVFGTIFGAFIFYRRRREQDQASLFSDAGGMMRLNLDELTTGANQTRLLNE